MPEVADSKPVTWIDKTELFLLSVASLFVELLVIRWLSGDIRAFSVFKTFPLVSCFLGLGVGMAFGKRLSYKVCAFAVFLFVSIVKLSDYLGISAKPFPSLSIYHFQDLAGLSEQFLPMIVLRSMVVTLALLIGPFFFMASIGGRLGETLQKFQSLTGYSINIAGSIAGSLLFTVFSFLCLPPLSFLALTTAILTYCMKLAKATPKAIMACFAVMACATALSGMTVCDKDQIILWSPYQIIMVKPLGYDAPNSTKTGIEHVSVGAQIKTGYVLYLYAIDLAADYIAKLPEEFRETFENLKPFYEMPYTFKSPKNVLIVGSGAGTDVGVALRHGATHVDAVDIDPTILKLGYTLNPCKPYNDPRVNVICDDARNFIDKCNSKYDLIIYSLLDSHTVLGSSSSVRLDNYVYTVEGLGKARSLLTPDGVAVITFTGAFPWLRDRLHETLNKACGYPPLVFNSSVKSVATYTYCFGEPVHEHRLQAPPGTDSNFKLSSTNVRTLTDDWPYLYLKPFSVDVPYLSVVLEIIVISIIAARGLLFKPNPPVMWQLFFQGSAFMLLELQAISRLSLLFGCTWVTSAIVINGFLILTLGANLLVVKAGNTLRKHFGFVWFALAAALAGTYMLPLESLTNSGVTGECVATLVTVLPMSIAGIIFAEAFDRVEQPHLALGMNLLGAIIGALLEYLSNFTGINNLVIVAAALYLVAFLFSSRRSPITNI